MTGDIVIYVDLHPQWPEKCDFIYEGYRELERNSYVGTPILMREFRLNVKLKQGVSIEDAFMDITKGCKSEPW